MNIKFKINNFETHKKYLYIPLNKDMISFTDDNYITSESLRIGIEDFIDKFINDYVKENVNALIFNTDLIIREKNINVEFINKTNYRVNIRLDCINEIFYESSKYINNKKDLLFVYIYIEIVK